MTEIDNKTQIEIEIEIGKSIFPLLYCVFRMRKKQYWQAIALFVIITAILLLEERFLETHKTAMFYVPYMAYGFGFGFVHLMTGRHLRKVAQKFHISQQEVQFITQKMYDETE